MLFGTFDFLIFFAIVIVLNWVLKSRSLIWRIFLFIVSVYFYALIDVKFVGLLATASILTFLLGLIIEKKETVLSKLAFAAGIILNLGMLFIFKYYDFFRVTAESFTSINLSSSLPYWEIIFLLVFHFILLE